MNDSEQANTWNRSNVSRLLTLPDELILSIFRFCDYTPPSEANFLHQPALSLMRSDQTPLKQLSRVCKKSRRVVLPLLFRHACLDPFHIHAFLEFITATALTSHISSVTATLQGPCSHLHPVWWSRLLSVVPLTTLSIIAPPHVFAELGQVVIDNSHSWAYNMPHHIISLQQRTSKDMVQACGSGSHLPNLLTTRRWTALTINEGSSLTAYATWEYFLKRPPSLFASLECESSMTMELLSQVKCFSYIAIFPFYNHVEEILKRVRKMNKLQIFFIKLCPEPESTVLAEEIERTRGHIDVNDPWNEFDTCWSLVADTVNFMARTGSLFRFEVDDIKMTGIRSSLESRIGERLADCWFYDGHGVWENYGPTEMRT